MIPRQVENGFRRRFFHLVFDVKLDRVCFHDSTVGATVFKHLQNVFSFAFTQVLFTRGILPNQRLTIFRIILRIVFCHIRLFLFGVGVGHNNILTFLLSKAMSSRPFYKEHTNSKCYRDETNSAKVSGIV